MHHRIDFMFVLIDLNVRFIVAGCLLYFQNEKGVFPCSGAGGQLYRGDNEMGATPAGSDARMATRAAAAVDH